MSQSQNAETTNLTRRQAMRGLVGGAAAVTVGSTGINYSTREAQAIAPAIPIVGFAAGAAIAYLMDSDTTPYLGDERDYSGYTGGTALKTAIREASVKMRSADERVMTSISNNITNSQNVALAKGKAAIIEAMNTGGSESEAQTAMQGAIDGYYATIQENILTHWTSQVRQIQHHYAQLDSHADTVPSDVMTYSFDGTTSAWSNETAYFALPAADDSLSKSGYGETTITLLDGSTVSGVPYAWTDSTSTNAAYDTHLSFDASLSNIPTGAAPSMIGHINGDGTRAPTFDVSGFETAWTDVTSERDSVYSTLSGFVTDVYNNWAPGDIPTENLVDPITASTELRQNYDGYQAQGAHAAMLGIPTTAEQSVYLTVHAADGDYTVWADLYTEYVPTDSSGNEIGFESGTKYDPATWNKPLYIAYEYTEETQDGTTTESDFVQLEDSFTIQTIEDKNGNEVSSFQTTSRNNQTADVSKLQEELDQLREEQQRLQEESQNDGSLGGGGGFLSDIGTDSNSTIIAAVAVILVAFGLLGNN